MESTKNCILSIIQKLLTRTLLLERSHPMKQPSLNLQIFQNISSKNSSNNNFLHSLNLAKSFFTLFDYQTKKFLISYLVLLELNTCLKKVKGNTSVLDRISYQINKPLTLYTKLKYEVFKTLYSKVEN